MIVPCQGLAALEIQVCPSLKLPFCQVTSGVWPTCTLPHFFSSLFCWDTAEGSFLLACVLPSFASFLVDLTFPPFSFICSVLFLVFYFNTRFLSSWFIFSSVGYDCTIFKWFAAAQCLFDHSCGMSLFSSAAPARWHCLSDALASVFQAGSHEGSLKQYFRYIDNDLVMLTWTPAGHWKTETKESKEKKSYEQFSSKASLALQLAVIFSLCFLHSHDSPLMYPRLIDGLSGWAQLNFPLCSSQECTSTAVCNPSVSSSPSDSAASEPATVSSAYRCGLGFDPNSLLCSNCLPGRFLLHGMCLECPDVMNWIGNHIFFCHCASNRWLILFFINCPIFYYRSTELRGFHSCNLVCTVDLE